ncbi:hypothetical protein ACIQU5_09930 [Streptomyces sp. NPDC090306]|uniref:hypothetical protein n=1 Tax=Streptomyces sp. NPDC090306 TaxID=3365961 RepID=UPI00381C53A0
MVGTQWTALAGTGLGAVVGVGSTLLVDRARRLHDHAERSRQERKEIYVACLARYRLAYEAMHDAASAAEPGAPAPAAAVRETFRASGCDEIRETALICAPQ